MAHSHIVIQLRSEMSNLMRSGGVDISAAEKYQLNLDYYLAFPHSYYLRKMLI